MSHLENVAIVVLRESAPFLGVGWTFTADIFVRPFKEKTNKTNKHTLL